MGLDEKGKELYDKLLKLVSSTDRFQFTDPKTKETLQIHTSPQRVVFNLVFTYRNRVPMEEIMEIIEGFTVAQSGRIDMNDPLAASYARQRWLDSMKKLFYLEYNSVKRFESTYGTLPDQLPVGTFMHSLGDGKMSFYKRMLFGQDMTEMTDEKKCQVGGEAMSIGQYLVKEGLIREDELFDATKLNMHFYQPLNSLLEEYHAHAVSLFYQGHHGGSNELNHSYEAYADQLKTRNRYNIKGPKLSFGEERNYWSDAISEGGKTLTGGRKATQFKRDHLNLYSPKERQDLKAVRKIEADMIRQYEEASKERLQAVKSWVKEFVGVEISEELLDRLIFFHPALLTGVPVKDIPAKDNEAFISFVNDFAGIDVPEEEKKAKRTEAYHKMAEYCDIVFVHPPEYRGDIKGRGDYHHDESRETHLEKQGKLKGTMLSSDGTQDQKEEHRQGHKVYDEVDRKILNIARHQFQKRV